MIDPEDQPTEAVDRLAEDKTESDDPSAGGPPTIERTILSSLEPGPERRVGVLWSIPGYEILDELGRGGMGVVYRARQVAADRQVALKMILPGHLGGDRAVERFHAEAEAIVQLDHPHIVPVYEVGEFEGRPYFSMKLVAGGSLSSRVHRMTGDLPASVEMTATVARAVHHAHQRGLIHRDLKPANILIDDEGRPYVTDFGLVKRTQVESDLTETGAVIGTPAYMAPEQASGEPDAVTTLADVYSLGVILYHLITGRPPFQGKTPLETLAMVADRPVVPPQLINAKVDLDLATVCLKCLSKDPTQRYSSAREFAEELDRWLAGDPVKARPPTLIGLAVSLATRHARASVALIVFGLLGGLICGLNLYRMDVQPPLTWNADTYPILGLPAPWLATIRIPDAVAVALGPAMALCLTCMGLVAILLARPRHAAGDLAVGLTVGSIVGVSAMSFGVGWALIYGTALSSTLEESRIVREVGVLPADAARTGPILRVFRDEFGRPQRIEVEPDWQYRRYPGLRGLPIEVQKDAIERGNRAELMVGVQKGIWYCLLAVGSIAAIGGVEGAVAGLMLRRHGRVRSMMMGYVEIIGPGVVVVYATLTLVVNLMMARSSFDPASWTTALILSLLAIFDRWPRPVRRAIQFALIAVLVAICFDAWPAHRY